MRDRTVCTAVAVVSKVPLCSRVGFISPQRKVVTYFPSISCDSELDCALGGIVIGSLWTEILRNV